MLMASRWTGIFSSMRVTDSRSATAIVTIRAWRILPGGLRRSSWSGNWEPNRLPKKPHKPARPPAGLAPIVFVIRVRVRSDSRSRFPRTRARSIHSPLSLFEQPVFELFSKLVEDSQLI